MTRSAPSKRWQTCLIISLRTKRCESGQATGPAWASLLENQRHMHVQQLLEAIDQHAPQTQQAINSHYSIKVPPPVGHAAPYPLTVPASVGSLELKALMIIPGPWLTKLTMGSDQLLAKLQSSE